MTMEIETPTGVEAASLTPPPASDTGTKTTETPAATPDATFTPEPIGDKAAEAPAYNPNYKFKAFGKEQELESFWHPLITDQDSEKKVKDLFTRAEAFDDLKSRFDGTQEQFSSLYNEYSSLEGDVKKVTSFLNNGDLDNFFTSVGLDQNKVFKWVADKLDQENLPPEQKAALQSQAQERQRIYELENENRSLGEQYQTQAAQARAMQLDTVLSRSDVSQTASAWDTKMGQIGAFRDLIVEEAQKAWFSQKQDLSAEQAVQLVITKYGKLISSGDGASQVPGLQAAPGQAPAQQTLGKPVIPALQGRGTSPVKKSPKSIEDLKQMAKELGA